MKFEISRFIKSVCSLVFSQILIKIFGMIYTLYITNKTGFGDRGNAIYMSGYQIYSLMLTVSSIGIPNAMAKLIAEKEVLRDFKNSKRIIYTASLLFGVIGFCLSVMLYFLSDFIADNVLQISESSLSIKVLSPAIFFVSISAVLRGYFNGKNRFKVGAKAQVFEQIIKTVFTIIFVEIVAIKFSYDTSLMAASANLATSLATMISFLYIVKVYYKEERLKIKMFGEYKKEKISYILRRVILIAFPVTLSVLISNISKNVDSVTIVRLLKEFIGEEEAIKLYGILSSKVDILISMPLSINSSISSAIIPEISELKVINNMKLFEKKIIDALDFSSLILMPCFFGMCFYSKEIFLLLFPNASCGYELLSLASITILFSGYYQTISGIMQGIDKSTITLYISIFSIIIKVILNIVLIRLDFLYEKGAVLSNIISTGISFGLIKYYLLRSIYIKNNLIGTTGKYFVVSLVMIILSKFMYCILEKFELNLYLTIEISIIFSAIIYVFLIILLKFLEKMRKIPNFETIENTEV